MNKMYYLVGKCRVEVLSKETEILNKKNFVIVRDLESRETIQIKRNLLRVGGILDGKNIKK